MNRKGFTSIIIAIIIAVIILAGGVYWYFHRSSQKVAAQVPSTQSTVVASTNNAQSSSTTTCATNFSDFVVPPLPTSTFNWIQLTSANATSVYEYPPSFSSTGEVLYPNAFSDSGQPPLKIALPGDEWFSSIGDMGTLDNGYYQPLLQKNGWSKEIDIDGYKLYGEEAGGFHGESDGYIKIENGYFRSIVIYWLTASPYPTNLLVYESDIVPLSDIISNYQPSCVEVGASASSTFTSSSTAQVGSFTVDVSCDASGGNGFASINQIEVIKDGDVIQTIPVGNNILSNTVFCPVPQAEDINSDGYPDFSIVYDYGNQYEDSEYWLYSSSTDQFSCPNVVPSGKPWMACSLAEPN
jgi:hypothetical protein